jgi:Protein of unknown function (DUF1838)
MSDRRTLLGAGLAAVSAAMVAPSAHARRRGFDFAMPADNLRAWMKLHTSQAESDLYYWYRCRIDGADPQTGVRALVGYDTLYRFQVRPQGDGTFDVTRWECCIYADKDTNAQLDSFVNPYTSETVRPFHFKEGPMTFRYSLERPYILSNAVVRRTGQPFVMPWTVAGPETWVTNETFVDMPHPLDPARFPNSSTGPRLRFSNIATLRGDLAELENPRVASARCRLSYQATSGWSPWLKMGTRPGFVVLRGQGTKFTDPAILPTQVRAAFERLHPEIFTRDPWREHRIMLLDYAKARADEG